MALDPLKAVPTIDSDVCGWHMQDYISLIKADYRAGWNDAVEGKSNIGSSIHYSYGYDDATEWQYSFRDE